MRLFKLPFTQKYDMFHLVGDDNILILKTSDFMKIEILVASLKRNNMTMYKEMPARAQRDCMYANDSSEYKQTIPMTDTEIQRFISNGYLINM